MLHSIRNFLGRIMGGFRSGCPRSLSSLLRHSFALWRSSHSWEFPYFDCCGALSVCAGMLLLSVPSARANHVIINSDSVLEIDGKKTFVICFTIAPPPAGKAPNGKNAIAELADAGATFLRAGPEGPWNERRFKQEK